MTSSISRRWLIGTLSLLPAGSLAFAQSPPPPTAATVRGTIENADGLKLTVKSRDGANVRVQLTEKTALVGLSRITIDDIKPNAFVGVAAVPQPDGALKAVSVHVFPDALRGTNEGSRSYDVAPNSSMTNGAVADVVVKNDGRILTIRYKDGEKNVVVEPSTSLVRFEPGAAAAELKPGVKIVVNAVKLDDGTLEARRILLGRGGVAPAL